MLLKVGGSLFWILGSSLFKALNVLLLLRSGCGADQLHAASSSASD